MRPDGARPPFFSLDSGVEWSAGDGADNDVEAVGGEGG